MTGGPITDGIYFETQEDDYKSETADNLNHRVIVFDQAHGGFSMNASDPTKQMVGSIAGTLTVSCTTFTVDPSPCSPSQAASTFQYTATPTTIALTADSHPNRLMHFTKQ